MVGVAYGKSELATEERILLREEGGESAERECIVLREGEGPVLGLIKG